MKVSDEELDADLDEAFQVQIDRVTEIMDDYAAALNSGVDADIEDSEALMSARLNSVWDYLAASICPLDYWLTGQVYALLVILDVLEHADSELTLQDARNFLNEGMLPEDYVSNLNSLCSLDANGHWRLRLEVRP